MSEQPTGRQDGSQRFRAAASAQGVELAVQRFPAGTRTAADAAAAIGCDVAAIVKSLVFETRDGEPVLVLTSGANRVDTRLAGQALGAGELRKADADAVRAATGYAIGGTPPFGHVDRVPVVVDEDLLALDEVWAAAGTPDTVFPIAPGRLVELTGGRVAPVAAGAA